MARPVGRHRRPATGVSGLDRRALRQALLATEPWLAATEMGPQAVDAGSCDRCGVLPRLLPTCGPVAWTALCRACGDEVGLDAWCEGHEAVGRDALAWAGALPSHWDVAVTLWWVANGELSSIDVRDLRRVGALGDTVRELLGR